MIVRAGSELGNAYTHASSPHFSSGSNTTRMTRGRNYSRTEGVAIHLETITQVARDGAADDDNSSGHKQTSKYLEPV